MHRLGVQPDASLTLGFLTVYIWHYIGFPSVAGVTYRRNTFWI